MHYVVLTQEKAVRTQLLECIDFAGNAVTFITVLTDELIRVLKRFEPVYYVLDMGTENSLAALRGLCTACPNALIILILRLGSAGLIEETKPLGSFPYCFFPSTVIEMRALIKRQIPSS